MKKTTHTQWFFSDNGTMKCLMCRRRFQEDRSFRYCPNCGSRMDMGQLKKCEPDSKENGEETRNV